MTARALLGLTLALCCAQAAAQQSADAPPAAAAASAPQAATPAPVPAPVLAPRHEPLVAQLPAAAGPSASGPSAVNLLQTIFGLCVVLALLAGLAWFLKRFGPRNATGNADLRIVGALNLGGRERIVVVEVGEQWIVVGASPGRINALAQMPRQKELNPAQAAAGAGSTVPGAYAPSATSFSEWLKQTIDKRK